MGGGCLVYSSGNEFFKRSKTNNVSVVLQDSQCADFLPEIRKLMDGRAEIPDLCAEEESMCEEFVLKKNWREG